MTCSIETEAQDAFYAESTAAWQRQEGDQVLTFEGFMRALAAIYSLSQGRGWPMTALTNCLAHELEPSLGDEAPTEKQKPVPVVQPDQTVPVGDAEASQIVDRRPAQLDAELVVAAGHAGTVTDYAVALVAADCSALICEHTTRLGLDPFAAATVARAVQARIMEIANVR